jgi:stage V sporulation protein R
MTPGISKTTPELQRLAAEIAALARGYGLDFFDVLFEVVDYKQMNEIAAYGGFPSRYPHWSFGMQFDQLDKGYSYGLQKIYEMVINNDPSYAYLLECNNLVDQKLVMAHVFAHVDFFKNNLCFAPTNRKMMDAMANHGTRVRKSVEKHGQDAVESFLDTCQSLDNLIDYHALYVRRRPKPKPAPADEEAAESRDVPRLRAKNYMESYINPEAFLDEQRERQRRRSEEKQRFPAAPERDVLLFLLENAPLERWQQDVLSVVREEAYYFAPQAQTKIMNEGWATYWHTKMMTERLLEASEVIDYADHHSGTVYTQPGGLNPYKLGLELFRNIEERWNRGQFGPEWEACEDWVERRRWDRNVGQGRAKIFEVRKLYNDVTFVDTYLTEDFCREHKLFHFSYNKQTDMYHIDSREFQKIKAQLLFQLTNFGQPIIAVTNGNYRNRGELMLTHHHEGIDLKLDQAEDTLRNLYRIWQRPVHLETVVFERRKVLSYDGKEHTRREIKSAEV